MLGPALSLAIVGTLLTAVVTGLAATWLFDFSTIEGLLLGAIVAGTDGAAIFALLRGSTLRRRLARTLEGESGLNDPIAVLLVLGFIERIPHPDYGLADIAVAVRRASWRSARVVGLAVGCAARRSALRERAAGDRRPVPGRDARRGRARLRRGRRAARLGLPGRLPRRAGARLGDDPGHARRSRRSTRAWRGSRSWRCSSCSACSSSRRSSAPCALEGTVLALVLVFVARPLATVAGTAPFGSPLREQAVLGWAGLRGAVPVVLATFPVIEGVPRSARVLQHRVLRGAAVDDPAGHDVRAARPAPGRDDRRAGAAAAAGRVGDDPPARRRGARVPGRRRATRSSGCAVRDLGLPREAVVNVIVREGQAIPPRGSTRVVRRRPPARALPRGGLAPARGADVVLADGADRAAGAAAARACAAPRRSSARDRGREADGDATRPDARRRPGGRRPAAPAPRRARQPRGARRRPLRGLRDACSSSARGAR